MLNLIFFQIFYYRKFDENKCFVRYYTAVLYKQNVMCK